MASLWIWFVLAYGLLKGGREGMKKAALKKNRSTEILFCYTLIGFLFTLPFVGEALALPPIFILFAFIKAAVVCAAWLCAFAALKHISVSLYGIMDLSRMVFSTLLGVFVLGESFTLAKAAGMLLVVTGLTLVNLKRGGGGEMTLTVFIAAMLNCFLNAVSGTMDKVLMQYMTSSQLQFWFMLFMTVIYGSILLIRRERVAWRALATNYWVPLMSLSLIVGDRLLFEANAHPQSEVTLMTVVKQSSVFVTVLTGWLVYHEKNIGYKLLCTLLVLAGIFVALFL